MTTRPPASALLLGVAGLIPFWIPVAISLWSVQAGRSNAAEAMLFTFYAGLILSFLGGVRWGEAIVRKNPPEAAALALAVFPSVWALGAGLVHWGGWPVLAWLMLGVGLFAQYHWDQIGPDTGALPAWYKRLRLLLTVFANGAAAAMIVIEVFL